MSSIVSQNIRKARKVHDCMAYEWLSNCVDSLRGFSFTEKRAIVLARRNGGKILHGEEYLEQCISEDGIIRRFKAIPAIHKICIDHDLYEYE